MIGLRNMTAIYLCRDESMLLLYRVGSRVVAPSWCGVGGHFEPQELNNPYACVLREMQEETGLTEDDLQDVRLRYVTLRRKNGEIRQNYYYFATLRPEAQLPQTSPEGELRWTPLDVLLQRDMPLTARQMLTHYMEVGRFNDVLYCGVTQEEGMAFTPLREF